MQSWRLRIRIENLLHTLGSQFWTPCSCRGPSLELVFQVAQEAGGGDVLRPGPSAGPLPSAPRHAARTARLQPPRLPRGASPAASAGEGRGGTGHRRRTGPCVGLPLAAGLSLLPGLSLPTGLPLLASLPRRGGSICISFLKWIVRAGTSALNPSEVFAVAFSPDGRLMPSFPCHVDLTTLGRSRCARLVTVMRHSRFPQRTR
jgi:hypothetical protein